MSFEASALALAWAAIILLAFAMSAMLGQLRRLTANLGIERASLGPQLGATAPTLNGHLGSWSEPTVLLFVDDECEACRRVIPEFLAIAERDKSDKAFAMLFSKGANGVESRRVCILSGQVETLRRFRIPVKPFAVVIDRGGIVRAARAIGSPSSLRKFMEETRERISIS